MFLKGILIITISIIYSRFIQQFIEVAFGTDKNTNDIITLIILVGFIGIIISGFIEDNYLVISQGLLLGSYVLLIDIITSNWTIMNNKLKLCITGLFLIRILQYAQNMI